MINEEFVEMMTPPAVGQTDSMELRMTIARAVVLWLHVANEGGRPFPDCVTHLLIEMDHSALLHRLLTGKRPLPVAPPTHFSSPWYELIDNGFAAPFEVWESKGTWASEYHGDDTLYIDQSPWKIVDRRGALDWLVKHERDENTWRVWSTGLRDGEQSSSKHDSTAHLWRIERCK